MYFLPFWLDFAHKILPKPLHNLLGQPGGGTHLVGLLDTLTPHASIALNWSPSRVKMGEDFIDKMEKQKWSFGTLKWSQWSQKKRYEQLRSSSIYWWCQMVRPGSENYEKGQCVFVIWITKSSPCCWEHILKRFCVTTSSENENSAFKNQFWFEIWSKI